MKLLLIILLGYVIGSVPFALVVGKVFYHTDVRQHGSKNLGGGNTGRVLGKKAGLAVMTLDILKVALVAGLATWLVGGETAVCLGGLAAATGHCFPLFAHFRGGKAVATMYGFLFGIFLFAGYSLLVFLFPLAVFLLVLYLTKIIALASITSAAAVTVFVFLTTRSLPVTATLLAFTLLILIRHRKNIERILQHRENKITWM